jgi:three-Cys-motif partner protein
MTKGNAKKFFRTVRPWQWIKHTIFTQYLKVWAWKVGSQAKIIWVIDAFAGTGEFRDTGTGEIAPGSPVRAALVAKEYNEHPNKKVAGKTLRLICIERDPEHHAELCERLKGFDFVTVLRGEFGEQADEIARMIGDDPALILLDPIGVKSIHADVCRKLLQRRGKTDAFVNVQFAIVHRAGGMLGDDSEPDPANAVARGNIENIDEFFGTKDWRKIAQSGKSKDEREAAYLKLYFDTVVGPRYSSKHAYPVRRTYEGPPRYFLASIADHPDAEWLINDLLAGVETRLYIQSRKREDPNMLEGFAEALDEARVETLRCEVGKEVLALLRAAPGQRLRYGQLCLALRTEHFGKLKHGDYSKIVKKLYGDDQLNREKKGRHPALTEDELIFL